MTVAIVVKVFDGIALATDSAVTVMVDGQQQVYNSASKIFHLHRDLPIAAMTWGLGSFGVVSSASLAKDLRTRLMGGSERHRDWTLDPASYTIREVSERLVDLMWREVFVKRFQHGPPASPAGFLVAGYSAGRTSSEAWRVELVDANTEPVPELAIETETVGWLSFAQATPTERLWNGIDREFLGALKERLTPAAFAEVGRIYEESKVMRAPTLGAMPLPDAIGLARFMVDLSSSYTHYLPGPDSVGGPVEVASVSRHEGFRWISRKHYYDLKLNPRETDHAS